MKNHQEELERIRKMLSKEEAERKVQKEREAVRLQRSKEIDDANNKIKNTQEDIDEADERLNKLFEKMDTEELSREEYLALDAEIQSIIVQNDLWRMEVDTAHARLDGLHQAEQDYNE